MLILELLLVTLLAAVSNSYTIAKDEIPTFPTASVIDGKLVKHLPNGNYIIVSCPANTALSKETLTCNFIQLSSDVNALSSILPSEDCRKFELCDGNICTEMSCPPPLLFNRINGVCDYPNMALCCEFDASNQSRILQD